LLALLFRHGRGALFLPTLLPQVRLALRRYHLLGSYLSLRMLVASVNDPSALLRGLARRVGDRPFAILAMATALLAAADEAAYLALQLRLNTKATLVGRSLPTAALAGQVGAERGRVENNVVTLRNTGCRTVSPKFIIVSLITSSLC
jgi:hypothetical protein